MAGNECGRDVLAEWEHWLRLIRVSDCGGTSCLVVEMLDDEGDTVDPTHYAHADFALAADDFHRRLFDRIGVLAGSPVAAQLQVFSAIANADGDALADLLHDEYVLVDRRLIGYPSLDKAGFIEAICAQGAGEVWLTDTLDVVTPQVILRTGGFWTLNYGRWTPYERGTYISVYAERRLARTEIFAEGRLDAALARCAELTALGPTS